MSRKLTLISLISLALTQGCAQMSGSSAANDKVATAATAPKNIIMVVADGMGPAYTTAYRNFADDPATDEIENVVFDDIFVGNASTYPAAVSGYVTDSAAAATALATGVKSYNGAIGVDANKAPVGSVLQRAKELGLRTGVAVTSQINHATPAAYMAHNESRRNYDALADSYFDDRINGQFVADVMLGGGTSYFEREDRNIVGQFIDEGYQYVDSYNKLATLPAGSKVLGLFAPVGLPAALDDERQNRLSYIAKNAVKHLENDKGFFLLIEASQVDWAGHSNDIGSAMAEMHDLALTMEYLRGYVAAHPDTLVVLTADHSTGGLTIGANGEYSWHPEYLRSMKASVATIANGMTTQSNSANYVAEQLGFSLSDEEIKQINRMAKQQDEKARETALKAFLDKKTNTGWTTGGHTGVDVEVFAFGAGSDAFAGQIDNTDIARNFFNFLNSSSAATNATAPANAKAENGSASKGCDFNDSLHCN
ncbi:alkaline phosphatase [Alteromonas pelagimontana]|uniref:Alkaline phosphatase n=1 Tax=Alteromonas pelagimontana TaxID=1858656 RepID=A0A6M4MFQ4_9ALTE|nr:alkaline phosphatase [Alteromonas pelagimontana]QJR82001.1 alkaline phosphatase [Alteromonas pelagimontana]